MDNFQKKNFNWKMICEFSVNNREEILRCIFLIVKIIIPVTVLIGAWKGLLEVYEKNYISDFMFAYALPYAIVIHGALVAIGLCKK